jgi:hypothetical protein
MTENLNVDPDKLRGFAGALDTTSQALSPLSTDAKFGEAFGSLPGTQLDQLMQTVATTVGRAVSGIAARLDGMSLLAHGNANDYEIGETVFADSLHNAGAGLPGGSVQA